MAPIGTVVKNGLIFAIIAAPLLYVSGILFTAGVADVLTSLSDDNGNITTDRESPADGDFYTSAILNFSLALIIGVVGTGIVYMKMLSDTIEEGMIEF